MRFFSTVELVNALEEEEAQGKGGRFAAALVKIDLVVLYELRLKQCQALLIDWQQNTR